MFEVILVIVGLIFLAAVAVLIAVALATGILLCWRALLQALDDDWR